MQSRFLTIQTDLSTYCNLKCRMCYFHAGLDVKKERVTFAQFDRLFNSFANRIRVLGLSCGTEPLLARQEDLFRIFDFIKEKGIPESNMVTNATLLNKRIAEKIVDSGITTLMISIDSHIKEKYEAIRIGAKFERVVENVKYLIDYRKRMGARRPFIQFNCVLAKYNLEDMPGYLDSLFQLGVDGVDFRHIVLHRGCGLEDQPLNKYKALANLYFDYIRKRCKKLKISLEYLPDNFNEEGLTEEERSQLKEITLPAPDAELPPRYSSETTDERDRTPVEEPITGSTDIPADGEEEPCETVVSEENPPPDPLGRICKIPLSFMQIRPDGDVLPCCYWYGEKPMGNLFETDFDTLWNKAEYVKLRREVSGGILIRHCCMNCPELGSGRVDEQGGFEEKTPS